MSRTAKIVLAIIALGYLLLIPFMMFGWKGTYHSVFPTEKTETSIKYMEDFRAHDFDAIKSSLTDQAKPFLTDEALIKLYQYMPQGDFVSRQLIGFNEFVHEGITDYTTTFEYQFPDKWVVSSVALQDISGRTQVNGISVYQYTKSLEEINQFSLADKPIQNYVVLATAVLLPIFIFCSLFVLAKTPIRRRKWLWYIFVAAGFGGFSVNWTTGQWRFVPINFQFFGAGAFTPSPYAPWLLTISLPVGAIVFLIMRKRLIARSAEPIPPPAEA